MQPLEVNKGGDQQQYVLALEKNSENNNFLLRGKYVDNQTKNTKLYIYISVLVERILKTIQFYKLVLSPVTLILLIDRGFFRT